MIGGDFNIAPTDQDVHDPLTWKDQVLCSPLEREAFSKGLTGKRRDAYVFGSLRKVGWKPKQEKRK